LIIELLKEKGSTEVSEQGKDYVTTCWSGLHVDSNPSMRVDIETGVYNCFVCGCKGNILQENNVIISPLGAKIATARELIDSLKYIQPVYPYQLSEVFEGYRNISLKTLQKFKVKICETVDISRLVVPIHNYLNQVHGYVGRRLSSGEDGKYSNFPRGIKMPLYPTVKPYFSAKDSTIILVEGIFDMMRLHDIGYTNTVCTFGTAFGSVKSRVKKQRNLDSLAYFKGLGVDKIVILFDGDDAGLSSARNLQKYLQPIYLVKVGYLPKGKDPQDTDLSDLINILEDLICP